MKFLTWDAVCRRRLARNYLCAPVPDTQLVEVVRGVGGIQAQMFAAAELAIGARVSGLMRQGVQTAVWEQRRLIKTYGPRGTLHLLPADELPLWMAGLRRCQELSEPPWYSAAGLEAARADEWLEAIGTALDGQCLTRPELAEAVAQRIGEWAREWVLPTRGDFLGAAALTGRLCFGPNQGSRITYVRPDQWAGYSAEPAPDEALATLCRRYLAAYGPATHQDFARWLGFKAGQARHIFEALGGELEEVTVEDHRAWLLANESEDMQEGEGAGDSVYLLPQYDCYILGCGPRSGIISEAARPRISTYGRGRIEGAAGLPVLLVNGVIAGLWERQKRGQKIELRVEVFGQLSPVQYQLLEAEATRVGTFLEARTTTLSMETLS